MEQRASGVLLHISALPSDCGVGDFYKSAFRFVDFLNKTKQRVWQVLPLGPCVSSCSPYSLCSSFALNPLYISLLKLREEGLVDNECYDACVSSISNQDKNRVNFEQVRNCKFKVLKVAYDSFAGLKMYESYKFKAFCTRAEYWLNDYCNFAAIHDAHPDKTWAEWPDVLRDYHTAAENMNEEMKKCAEFHKFLQFKAHEQWDELRTYAHSKDVQIFGDLAIYCDFHSADCWSHVDIFDIDKETMKPNYVSGVPPDYFSENGQLWMHPVYNWDVLKKSKYAWWVERLKCNLALLDMVRIDHFRGLESFYRIPYSHAISENNAKVGDWKDAFGSSMLSAFMTQFEKNKRKSNAKPTTPGKKRKSNESAALKTESETVENEKKENNENNNEKNISNIIVPIFSPPIIAEDLGVITEKVINMREKFGFPSMRVLQFAFGDCDDVSNTHIPFNCEAHCVIYTGTHDNSTTCGWWKSVKDKEKQHFSQYIDYKSNEIKQNEKEVCENMKKLAFYSTGRLCIIPLQDILQLDDSARFNDPSNGNSNLNWTWKLHSFDELESDDVVESLAKLTKITGRAAIEIVKKQ